jgi:hypothetical protein
VSRKQEPIGMAIHIIDTQIMGILGMYLQMDLRLFKIANLHGTIVLLCVILIRSVYHSHMGIIIPMCGWETVVPIQLKHVQVSKVPTLKRSHQT